MMVQRRWKILWRDVNWRTSTLVLELSEQLIELLDTQPTLGRRWRNSCEGMLIRDCRRWCYCCRDNRLNSLMFRRLVDESTMLPEEILIGDRRRWCCIVGVNLRKRRSEIPYIGFTLVEMVDEALMMTIRRLSGNDHTLIQPKAFQQILWKRIFMARYTCTSNVLSLLEKSACTIRCGLS